MTTVKVEGMKCQHCSSSVMNVLQSFAELSECKVDLEKGHVSFEGQVDLDALKGAIEAKGFKVVGW